MSVVLVTGAGGFVGSAIVRSLVRGSARFWDGAPVEHVVALLRPGGSDERLAELELDGSWSVAHADVADGGALAGVFEQSRPRAVVHAALDPAVHAREDEELVRRPLENLLAGLVGTPGARLLQVGSAWVLASGDRLGESAPMGAVTSYGRNKAREETLLGMAGGRGVPWINLRLFNLFGRHEKPTRLLPTLVARLSRGETVELTHGGQVRDFNDVDVAAGSFVHALAAGDDAWGAVYHIGSGRGTSVRDLAFAIAAMVGRGDLIRFGASATADEDVPVLVADPSLAVRILGWRPDGDLEARLRDAVDWWLARIERPAATELTA